MKTVFTITVDTDLEVESYWWRLVLTRYMEGILAKEASERQKRKPRINTGFFVSVDYIEGGTPCSTDGEQVVTGGIK